MRKLVNSAFIYAIVGLSAGLFYREYTVIRGFEGKTMLSVLHTHSFALGMMTMLIVLVLYKIFELDGNKKVRRFIRLYNVGLPLSLIMMLIRGITQVEMMPLSTGADAAIAGTAGIGHTIIGIAIVFLFLGLREAVTD